MVQQPRSIRVKVEPEIDLSVVIRPMQRALLYRSDQLQKEAASETPGTFKQLIAARLSMELRNLALDLEAARGSE